MNELIKRSGSTEVSDLFNDDDIDALVSGIAQSRATTPLAGGEPILRLSRDGHWIYGQGDDPVQEGSEWAVNPGSIMHGWVCWSDDSKLAGEVMAHVSKPKPARPDPIGNLAWKEQRTCNMKCVYGDDDGLQVIFKTSSIGGLRAFDLFMSRLVPQVLHEKETVSDAAQRRVVAIVELTSDSYPNKKYGGVTYFPVIKINDWANMRGETDKPVLTPTQSAAMKAATVEVPPQRPSAAPRRRPQERA